jgi:demethylmenaquinone methyltransferase/2-methoxy-6-polyprenyl-1,4-benzoquinol methylase
MNSSKPVKPHPVLTDYYADASQRPGFVRALFDRTASHYDRINSLFSFGSGHWYRRHALTRAGLQAGMGLLDVATGTGLVAREAATIVGDDGVVVGLDLSAGMLAEAQRLLKNIAFVQGAVEQLPIADASFDFVSMGYGLRHVADLTDTFREYHRVLKPSGAVLILEIGQPKSRLRRTLISAYLGRIVPFLSRWTTGAQETQTLMRYFWDTVEQCVSKETILQALSEAGFAELRCDEDFDIFRAYVGRKGPAKATRDS